MEADEAFVVSKPVECKGGKHCQGLLGGRGEMKSRRLGRGFEFLLSSQPPLSEGVQESSTRELSIQSISSNPWQPRKDFEDQGLDELAQSIKCHGVLQPLIVRPGKTGGYELIAGERRLLAARRAGLQSVPAVVREASDEQMLPLALIENVQRRDLDPIEKSKAYQRLISEYQLTHQQIADLAGVARSTISNLIRILDLPAAMLGAVRDGRITEGHARVLLTQSNAQRRQEMFERFLRESVTVREAEMVARKTPPRSMAGRKKTREARQLEKQLAEHLGARVEILERGQKGRLVIHYASLKEFERMFRVLTGKDPEV